MAMAIAEESDIIAVGPMDKDSAVTLFRAKLGVLSDIKEKDINKLTDALDYMPLAIVQAASYVRQRAPRVSLSQYLEDFQRSYRKKVGLLSNYEGGQLRRDKEAKNVIFTTWQMSFNNIQNSAPSAANLLALMSFFDRQGIPDFLLRDNGEGIKSSTDRDEMGDGIKDKDKALLVDTPCPGTPDTGAIELFEDDILTLRNYSLISVDINSNNFEMHRLVQLAMQEWLKKQQQFEQWNQVFIQRLSRNVPTGEFENWPRCQLLYTHARRVISKKPKGSASVEEWALILHNAAWYAFEKGYTDCKEMASLALATRRELFGPQHEKTIDSLEMLGLAHRLSDQWDKVEEIQVEVAKSRKQVQGLEHPDTLTSIGQLASIYSNQGRWKEAEELLSEVLEARKRVLGANHTSTLASIANLASIYWRQQRLSKAEALQSQVLESEKQVLGLSHPSTLLSMNNLAHMWKSADRDEDALRLMAECVHLSEQSLGEDHPDTKSSRTTLEKWQDPQPKKGLSDASESLKPPSQPKELQQKSDISTGDSSSKEAIRPPLHDDGGRTPDLASPPRQRGMMSLLCLFCRR